MAIVLSLTNFLAAELIQTKILKSLLFVCDDQKGPKFCQTSTKFKKKSRWVEVDLGPGHENFNTDDWKEVPSS